MSKGKFEILRSDNGGAFFEFDDVKNTVNTYFGWPVWQFYNPATGDVWFNSPAPNRYMVWSTGQNTTMASNTVNMTLSNSGILSIYNSMKVDHIGEYTSSHGVQFDSFIGYGISPSYPLHLSGTPAGGTFMNVTNSGGGGKYLTLGVGTSGAEWVSNGYISFQSTSTYIKFIDNVGEALRLTGGNTQVQAILLVDYVAEKTASYGTTFNNKVSMSSLPAKTSETKIVWMDNATGALAKGDPPAGGSVSKGFVIAMAIALG